MKFRTSKIREVKQVVCKEWYTLQDDKVHVHWRFPSGEEMTTLTPYKELPWIEWKEPSEI